MSGKKADEQVLDGRSSRPWEYKRWEKDVESAFKAKDLYAYFTGDIPSSYLLNDPEFQFVLEETMYREPDVDADSYTVPSALFETPKKEMGGGVKLGQASSGIKKEDLIQEIVRKSPGTEGFRMSVYKTLTNDRDFYWRRVDEHKRELHHRHALRNEHSGKVNQCLDILRQKTSPTLQRTLRSAFDSRDVRLILNAIEKTCGPTKRAEGLGLLDEAWVGIRLKPEMTVETLLQNVEDMAHDFEAYNKYKDAAEMRQAVQKAMVIAYPDFEAKWSRLFEDLDDTVASWERSKLEIHAKRNKLLTNEAYRKNDKASAAAIVAAVAKTETKQAKKEQAKKEEAKKEEAKKDDSAGKDDVAAKAAAEEKKHAAAERLKNTVCWNCGQKGHRKDKCTNPAKEPADADNKTALCTVCDEDEVEWTCDPDELMAPLTDSVEMPEEEKCAVVAERHVHLMDSGTMSHCNNDPQNILENFSSGIEQISLGKKSNKVPALGRGQWGIRKRVLWAPQMSYSLTSTSQLDKDGYFSIFGNGECIVLDPEASAEMIDICERMRDRVRMRAELKNGLYHVDEEFEGIGSVATVGSDKVMALKKGEEMRSKDQSNVGGKPGETLQKDELHEKTFTFNKNARLISGKFGAMREGSCGDLNDLELLHLRCGHVSRKMLLLGLKNNAFEGAQTTYAKCKDMPMRPCEACWLGKMRAQHVPQSLTAKPPLLPMQEISIDPVPLTTLTVDGNDVINFGIDYGTGYVFTYESKGEGNQKEIVKRVIRDFCVPYGHTIKKVHTDFAKIFLAKEFQNYLLSKNIAYESSPPYQHQFNRVEGCSVRPLQQTAVVLLAESGLPPRFAGYAVRSAADCHNATLHGGSVITPFEALTGKKPDLSGMRQFGQIAYCFLNPQERMLANDVRWKERAMKGIVLGNSREVPGGYYIYPGGNRKVVTRGSGQVVVMEGRESDMLPTFTDRFKIEDELFQTPSTKDAQTSMGDKGPKPKRVREPPDDVPATRMSARLDERRRNVVNGIKNACMCCSDETTIAVCAPHEAVTLPKTPRSIAEAERLPESNLWMEAMQREIDVMLNPEWPKYEEYNGKPKRFMRAVLAFRVKVLDDGKLQFKTRICPDGSTQQQGVDFQEKYSPTVSREIILMVLHIAGHKNWQAKQFDVGAAYLEVPAQHEQFMRLTPDMVRVGFARTEFVRLLANFYGNPDAGRHWYRHMTALLLEFGMSQSIEAPCLFTTREGVGENMRILVVLLVVDDGLYAGNWITKSEELEAFLRERLQKVKIGPLNKFVGMQIERDFENRKVYVHTRDYDALLLDKYSLGTAASAITADTPLYNTVEYRGIEGTEKPIRGVVGSVNFTAGISWPELKVPVSLLASAGDKPHVNHVKGAKRLLQYMEARREGRALHLGGAEPVCLVAYTDASYTPEGDSLYLYGYALALSCESGAFQVVSKRSKTVSHSSLQSEIKAINEACKEIESARRLLEEFGCPQEKPTVVLTDSQSSIDLIANYFGYHPKCRHFNRDINYVRQCVDMGIIILKKIDTEENPADLLTKLSTAVKTAKFTENLLHGMGGAESVDECAMKNER